MSKDAQTIILIMAGIIVLTFVLWIIGSIIQFLNDNRFVYGLLVGLVGGIAGTLFVISLIRRLRRY